MRPRSLLRATLLVLPTFAAACGAEPPPPATPPPAAAVPPPPPPPPARAEVAPPPNVDPTVLSEAQRAADKALAPKIEAILDALGNGEPTLSRDGKTVLFRSNRGGVSEAYVGDVAKPADPPRRVVAGPERIASITYTHDGKYILFRRDQGADENFALYRANAADGGAAVNLTPNEKTHRDEPLLPRGKPDVLVYSARTTSSAESKVYVQSIAGGEPKVAFTDPGPAFAVDVSPDGARAIVLRVVSPSDQIAFEVNLANGKARRVYPGEGKKASVDAVSYSADGKRVLVATDEGGESASVLALDVGTLAEKARYKVDRPVTARVAQIRVSPRGDRVAVAVDAGNHVEARLLDAATLASKMDLKAQLGEVELGAFTNDGRRLTLVESLPDAPRDIFVADVATGAVKPLRADARPGFADLPAVTTSIESVKAHDGLTIPVNLFLPKGVAPGQRLPTIVEFHGGPAASSVLGWNVFVRAFTSQGFAVVEPNIRGSTGFGRAYEMADNKEKRADALKDVATVNAWARAQSWCDAGRLVIFGGSYGGYLVLMGLTRQPDLWRAGIDLVGVADLRTFLKSTDQGIRVAFVDELGDLDKDAKLLEEFSPIRGVDRITSPLFVYQGQNDPRVPRSESDLIVRAMRARKVPVEYMVAPDEGHSLDRRANRVEFLTRVVRFLREQMK